MKLNVETQYCFIIKLIALLSFLCLQNEREAFFFSLSLSPNSLCNPQGEKYYKCVHVKQLPMYLNESLFLCSLKYLHLMALCF